MDKIKISQLDICDRFAYFGEDFLVTGRNWVDNYWYVNNLTTGKKEYFGISDKYVKRISKKNVCIENFFGELNQICMEEDIAKYEAEQKALEPCLCCVCKQNYVDTADGFDTCNICASRI